MTTEQSNPSDPKSRMSLQEMQELQQKLARQGEFYKEVAKFAKTVVIPLGERVDGRQKNPTLYSVHELKDFDNFSFQYTMGKGVYVVKIFYHPEKRFADAGPIEPVLHLTWERDPGSIHESNAPIFNKEIDWQTPFRRVQRDWQKIEKEKRDAQTEVEKKIIEDRRLAKQQEFLREAAARMKV